MNPRRFARALGKSAGLFFKKQPVFVLFVLAWIAWAIFAPPETAREREARESRDASRVERDEHLHMLCKAKAACQRWVQVRQECATAGNFDTCVNIKMEPIQALTSYCKNDGHMFDESQEPSAVECLFH